MAIIRQDDILVQYAEMYVSELLDDLRQGRLVDDYRLDMLLNGIEDERQTAGRALSYTEGDDIEVERPPIFSTMIEEARSLLRDGLREDAIERLSKLARPKWGSEAECRKAYQMHMAVQRIASSPGATS